MGGPKLQGGLLGWFLEVLIGPRGLLCAASGCREGPWGPRLGRGAGAHPLGHGLAQVLHPVGHLSLAVSAQLQAGPVGKDDLEGVGPVRGVGSPTATALLPPGPEEEGETGRGGRGGTGELLGLPQSLGSGGHQRVVQTPQLGSPTPTSFLCNTFNLQDYQSPSAY